MKNIYLYFMIFLGSLLFNGCSKNDDSVKVTEEESAIELPKEAFKMQFVEAKVKEPLLQEEYDATLGGEQVKVVKIEESKILFYIPNSIKLGKNDLKIPSINVNSSLDIKEGKLVGNESTVLQPFFSQINPLYHEITEGKYHDYLKDLNKEFNKYYTSLTKEEKDEMALFYQINKTFLDGILNPYLNAKSPVDDVYALVLKHKKAVAVMFAGGVITALGNPIIGIAIIITGVVIALHNDGILVEGINVVMDFVKKEGVVDDPKPKLNNDNLIFISEKTKTINFDVVYRKLITDDRNKKTKILSEFFEAHDVLFGYAQKINNFIIQNSDNILLKDISLIPLNDLPATSQTITQAVSDEYFENMSFNISHTNLSLIQSTFTNSDLLLKVKILDTSVSKIPADGINTNLRLNYDDGINNVNKMYPITVNLNTDDFLLGSWKLISVDGIVTDQVHIISTCDGSDGATDSTYTLFGSASFSLNNFTAHVGRTQTAKECDSLKPIPGLNYSNPQSYPHTGTYESNDNYKFTVLTNTNGITQSSIDVIDKNNIIISVSPGGVGSKQYKRN